MFYKYTLFVLEPSRVPRHSGGEVLAHGPARLRHRRGQAPDSAAGRLQAGGRPAHGQS